MSAIRRFEDIEAWQLGRELNRLVYEVTSSGAFATDFALRDQIRRAAISVSSNVAEGYARRSPADFARFLVIARASATEVTSQMYLALDLGYVDQATFDQTYTVAQRAGAACAGLARYLRTSSPPAVREIDEGWDVEDLNPEPRTPNLAPVVVKLGGAVLADAAAVWAGIAAMDAPAVVVHGGGPQATALARRLGHEPTIVAGRRVTSDLDLDVALYTLRGALNVRLVGAARAAGVRAAGVSGADGGLVTVEKRPPVEVDGAMVDFGHVGDVVAVDVALLTVLLEAGFVPVVATVCADAAGALYNVNADTVAAELAAALGASRLDLVTEAGGVRRDVSDPASLLGRLTEAEVDAGVAAGWIAGGMRPKLETARAALARGVPAVRVCAPADLGGPGGTVVVP